MEKMAPQYEKDKILIRGCVAGLTLYAAQHAAKDPYSPKLAELRSLVEQLACYWGLEGGDAVKLQNEFLQPFDNVIGLVPSGASLEDEIGKYRATTVRGLYRYGMEMVFCQGADCRDDILATRDLINEIACAWDFESTTLDNMTRELEIEARKLKPASDHDPNNPAPRTDKGMDAQIESELTRYAASEEFALDVSALGNDYYCQGLPIPDEAALKAEALADYRKITRSRLECEANGHQFIEHADGENGCGTLDCTHCGFTYNYQW